MLWRASGRAMVSVQAELGLNPVSNSGLLDSDSHSFLVGQWAFSIKAVIEAVSYSYYYFPTIIY